LGGGGEAELREVRPGRAWVRGGRVTLGLAGSVARFKAGSWQSGPTIASTHEAQLLTQVEQFLADHPGDYVRLLGIDPKAKQRQWEQMIQKPE
jgi:carbon dioxide concentrating mechanism protein CcmM